MPSKEIEALGDEIRKKSKEQIKLLKHFIKITIRQAKETYPKYQELITDEDKEADLWAYIADAEIDLGFFDWADFPLIKAGIKKLLASIRQIF